LVNPKKLFDLPSFPGPAHNGGKLKIGPDSHVYSIVGNLNLREIERFLTRTENLENGADPDGRAGILRMTQDGLPIPNGSIIGDKYPLNLYYAYGIRNSFGMDFDPLTGILWDTENGPAFGDEINLVEPGFNSGWSKIQGVWRENESAASVAARDTRVENLLVDFDGRGKYSDPELTWKHSIGLTLSNFWIREFMGTNTKMICLLAISIMGTSIILI
jgi:glucose/arabinose dehydrogenase